MRLNPCTNAPVRTSPVLNTHSSELSREYCGAMRPADGSPCVGGQTQRQVARRQVGDPLKYCVYGAPDSQVYCDIQRAPLPRLIELAPRTTRSRAQGAAYVRPRADRSE